MPEKLSLGLARIEGGPSDFLGINIRSPTCERKGNGKNGLKASGLLMVEGTLYLWARNAGNAQLAWSSDHGQTWTWTDWKFSTSFGCPAFLNFGRNYAGAGIIMFTSILMTPTARTCRPIGSFWPVSRRTASETETHTRSSRASGRTAARRGAPT